jgi:Reverse transcriptase (RNA-dependent DNA polymerase)
LFLDEDENEDTSMITVQIMLNDESYLATISDAPNTLKEAKNSDNWTEWENRIHEELEQLQAMGTWKVVDKPRSVIPIANKWLFIKKTDSMGLIIQYKAHLVVKECSQRPIFDFNKIYSPVVHLETVIMLLAMVPDKDLWISQMDVKGAYLNGKLQKNVYMRQSEGYTDGTNKVCHLLKTLYGLRQSEREWNNEFNKGMQSIGFKRLLFDPYAYLC